MICCKDPVSLIVARCVSVPLGLTPRFDPQAGVVSGRAADPEKKNYSKQNTRINSLWQPLKETAGSVARGQADKKFTDICSEGLFRCI